MKNDEQPQNQGTLAKGYGIELLILAALFIGYQMAELPIILVARGHPTWITISEGTVGLAIGMGLIIFLALRAYRRVHASWNWHLKSTDWNHIGIGLIVIYVGQFGFGYLNRMVSHTSGTQNNEAIASILGQNTAALVLMTVTAVFIAPVIEELIFRGLLIDGVFNKQMFWTPIVLSGLLFGLVHVTGGSDTIFAYLTYALMGMALAWVYRQSDNLAASITTHMINNGIAMVIMIISLNVH